MHRALFARADNEDLTQHIEFAQALYASALARSGGSAGELKEAAAILDALPPAMRALISVKRIRASIADAQGSGLRPSARSAGISSVARRGTRATRSATPFASGATTASFYTGARSRTRVPAPVTSRMRCWISRETLPRSRPPFAPTSRALADGFSRMNTSERRTRTVRAVASSAHAISISRLTRSPGIPIHA